MQHLRDGRREGWVERGLRGAAVAVLGFMCLGVWMGRGALAEETPSNMARLSFVQGGVQVLSGGNTAFDQAVMNMPLMDGATVQTGADGQAEIEFNDGSVVRLTPNSSLQLEHVGQDQVQLQQLAGLAYYELNFGQGHPPYVVEMSNGDLEPTANSIFRLDLDSGEEVAVMSGALHLNGNGIPSVDVSENESVRFDANNPSPFVVAQGINEQSWDQWNRDRDQEIAQEASQQTAVRDDSGSADDENWNDLDAYGDWYSMPDSGNVWVPADTGADWDPFGYGYWGFYPGSGYTWISGYPWGWLPYHCGSWNYFSFGWGWSPGGCGQVWLPVVIIRSRPPGYFLPPRPIMHQPRPVPSQRLLLVDRGEAAKGPWAGGHPVPLASHRQSLEVNGRVLQPIGSSSYRSQAFAGNRGTSPGVRAVLNGSGGVGSGRPEGGVPRAPYSGNYPSRPGQGPASTYTPPQPYTPRGTYVPRSTPTPHYSAPAPHYSPPPPPHYSPPPSPHPRGR